MRSTKFVVIKMRELIKTAVFAVLGVIILIGLIWFFLNLGEERGTASAYRDGTYHAQITVGDEWAMVAVTVDDGFIDGVALSEYSEAALVFYPLLDAATQEVSDAVVANQSLSIEVSAQNANTAQAILQGVALGLEEAER